MIGVEVETGIADDIISRKLEQFYYNTPLRECYVLSVDDLPSDIHAIEESIRGQL